MKEKDLLNEYKYLSGEKFKQSRLEILDVMSRLTVQDLATFVKEEFTLAGALTDREIKAIFADDVKIDRYKYARFIGNIEGMLRMLLVDIAKDTILERRRSKKGKTYKRTSRKVKKSAEVKKKSS